MSLSVRPLPGSLVREFRICCYMYDCFINHFPFFPTSLSNSTKLLFDIEKFFSWSYKLETWVAKEGERKKSFHFLSINLFIHDCLFFWCY